jgi:aminoglycoside phosphotransferase (APT) family kinase protein
MSLEARRQAVDAAIEVAADAGFAGPNPLVLQDTNNVVVWLRPYDLVAKVGVWAHSADVLGREVQVCSHLAGLGAPTSTPVDRLRFGATTGLPVSLWRRVEPGSTDQPTDRELAEMLARVHDGLASCPVELPSYLAATEHAQRTLLDDDSMRLLVPAHLDLLRHAVELWLIEARRWPTSSYRLHGEPHTNNVILTRRGPVLVDFEAACVGPIEWDLASMPPGVASSFDPDADLLHLLRRLNSARVATWGWALGDHPVMRSHGEHHLAVVREALHS